MRGASLRTSYDLQTEGALKQLFEEFKGADVEARKKGDPTPTITINGQEVQLFHKQSGDWERYSRMVRTDELWWVTVQVAKRGSDDYFLKFYGPHGIRRATLDKRDRAFVDEADDGELAIDLSHRRGPGDHVYTSPLWSLREGWKYEKELNEKHYYEEVRCLIACEYNLVWITAAVAAVTEYDVSPLVSPEKEPILQAQWLGAVAEDNRRDIRERVNAASQLGKMGPAAEPALPSLIQVIEQYGRSRFGGKSSVFVARTHYTRSDHDWITAAAADVLGKIGKGAAPAFYALMEPVHYAGDYYKAAARSALGEIGRAAWNEVKEGFKDAIRSNNVRRRIFAVQVLGDIGTSNVVPLLKEASHDPSSAKVRDEATGVLKELSR